MNPTEVATALLEDDEDDPKDYVMSMLDAEAQISDARRHMLRRGWKPYPSGSEKHWMSTIAQFEYLSMAGRKFVVEVYYTRSYADILAAKSIYSGQLYADSWGDERIDSEDRYGHAFSVWHNIEPMPSFVRDPEESVEQFIDRVVDDVLARKLSDEQIDEILDGQ